MNTSIFSAASFGISPNAMEEVTLYSLNSPDDSFQKCSPQILLPAELPFRQHPTPTPTPEASAASSPMITPPYPSAGGGDLTTVSVSTAFHPGAHGVAPDTVFTSSDNVLFYVSSDVLKNVSDNAFYRVFEGARTIWPVSSERTGASVTVPETSAVLNVILHIMYGTSVAQHSPTFGTLVAAVDHMFFYDLKPKDFVFPQAPLYELLLQHAPLYPLQLYALAGHHDLNDLAVATSSHLLSYSLANLDNVMAERMGALYLKRLMLLHLNRFNALRHILLQPPFPHPATKECGFEDQKGLTRAWALVAAYLAWEARPDLSTYSMRSSFQPLAEDITCNLCRLGLQGRVKDIIIQWASVRHTV